MAEQIFQLPAAFTSLGGNRFDWLYSGGNFIPVDASLRGSTLVYFRGVIIFPNGDFQLFLSTSPTDDLSASDLSDQFENSGSVTVSSAGNFFTVQMNGIDTVEPYAIPATENPASQDVINFYNYLDGLDPMVASGTVTIRDNSTQFTWVNGSEPEDVYVDGEDMNRIYQDGVLKWQAQ